MEFVSELEKVIGRSLETVNIGGGMATSFTGDTEPEEYSFSNYRKLLDESVPDLFEGKYNVQTEFGHSLMVKAGKSVLRVEYVKNWFPDVRPIIMTTVGSNHFMREAYRPENWRHRMTLADSDGKYKSGEEILQDVAGPVCFQGDYLAKRVPLPKAEVNHLLVVHDTGAYCLAFYSKYNSIQASPVYGFKRDSRGGVRFVCFKERETCDETLQFWGLEQFKTL